MLSNLEYDELIKTLQDLRKQLVWLTNQIPLTTEQRECIEDGKNKLYSVNKLLGDFSVKLSN